MRLGHLIPCTGDNICQDNYTEADNISPGDASDVSGSRGVDEDVSMSLSRRSGGSSLGSCTAKVDQTRSASCHRMVATDK